jgi:hypothetical protein
MTLATSTTTIQSKKRSSAKKHRSSSRSRSRSSAASASSRKRSVSKTISKLPAATNHHVNAVSPRATVNGKISALSHANSSCHFTSILARTPGLSLVDGLTINADQGLDHAKADARLAQQQHRQYLETVKKHCDIQKVHCLPSLEQFPDSCFVEDTAVITPAVVVLTVPARQTRRNEVAHMKSSLEKYCNIPSAGIGKSRPVISIDNAVDGALLEGGDVMRVGNHYYVGIR